MIWELANEPQQPPFRWIDETSAYVKSLAPNQLVSPGHEAKTDEADFFTTHRSRYVDVTTIHIWPQNRGVYDMMNASQAHLDETVQWAVAKLAQVKVWADRLEKPLLLEEFGLARDNWHAPPHGYPYSPSHPTTHRDQFYSSLLQSVKEMGCIGFGFWVYSGTIKGADPPHEPSGWYSIYPDDDSTWKVIQSFARP